jgi:hypothetical protein
MIWLRHINAFWRNGMEGGKNVPETECSSDGTNWRRRPSGPIQWGLLGRIKRRQGQEKGSGFKERTGQVSVPAVSKLPLHRARDSVGVARRGDLSRVRQRLVGRTGPAVVGRDARYRWDRRQDHHRVQRLRLHRQRLHDRMRPAGDLLCRGLSRR